MFAFKENGVVGFSVVEVSGAVEISGAEYAAAIEANHQRGATLDIVGGQLVIVEALPPTLEEYRAAKLFELDSEFDRCVSAITAHYPQAERESFLKQEAQARAFADGGNWNASLAPFLAEMAAAEGVTVLQKVGEVLAKAAAFEQFMARAIGRRHVIKNQINAATTTAQLQNIDCTVEV